MPEWKSETFSEGVIHYMKIFGLGVSLIRRNTSSTKYKLYINDELIRTFSASSWEEAEQKALWGEENKKC